MLSCKCANIPVVMISYTSKKDVHVVNLCTACTVVVDTCSSNALVVFSSCVWCSFHSHINTFILLQQNAHNWCHCVDQALNCYNLLIYRDSRIVDPDPQKQYTTQKLQVKGNGDEVDEPCCTAGDIDDTWPKGPYTQQIEGVLPPIFTDSIILSHLQKSGKQLKARQSPRIPTDECYSAETGLADLNYCLLLTIPLPRFRTLNCISIKRFCSKLIITN